MLTHDPELEGCVVRWRPSMNKFNTGSLTLEICGTFPRPLPCLLNRPLIAVLETLGIEASIFLGLQEIAVDAVKMAEDDLLSAAELCARYGYGSAYHLPTLLRGLNKHFGFERPDELSPLLGYVLRCAVAASLRDLKHKASIPVDWPSCTLVGVADEWDEIPEGRVYAAIVLPGSTEPLILTGEFAITRSPCAHVGDVQLVKGYVPRETSPLRQLRNVVVFSVSGQRDLPSCLGGGDLDGAPRVRRPS